MSIHINNPVSGGETDHSKLTNLDFSGSGHTGFLSTATGTSYVLLDGTRSMTSDLSVVGSVSCQHLAVTSDVSIANGGTGESTAQAAINALTAVSGATNEHVLTKDTATGNATFKAADSGANAALDNLASVAINTTIASDGDNIDSLGETGKTFRDLYLKGDITDETNTVTVANLKTSLDHVTADGTSHANVVLNDTHRGSNGTDHANVVLNDTHRGSAGTDHSDVGLNNTHRGSNGTDHSYIDQDVTATGTPTFASIDVSSDLSVVGSVSCQHLAVTSDISIANGGTGESTAQAAINALTAVSGATNEHVLTKDTATGNATFKAGVGGGASTALDNLAAVAINTTIASDGDNIDSLGSTTYRWANAHIVALGRRNLIINGGMTVAQRGTSFVSPANTTYTLDRWKQEYSGDIAYTITQDTDVPNGTFYNSLKLDVTTAEASVDATDYALLQYFVEGLDCIPLGLGTADAVIVTLSFWVKSTITGTYCVTMGNNAADRHYLSEYTINSSNTWEKKEITITLDTSGTWLKTSGIGMRLYFTLMSGSAYQGTAGSWQDAFKIRTANQVNGVSSTDNNFYLTGAQLEIGSAATDFESRHYQQELDLCERYYESQTVYTINGVRWIGFRTKKRSAPTVTVGAGSSGNITADGYEHTHNASASSTVSAESEL